MDSEGVVGKQRGRLKIDSDLVEKWSKIWQPISLLPGAR